MLTAGCCKSQVQFENTEQYDDDHDHDNDYDEWGDALNKVEHHCYVSGGQWSNGMNEI